VDARTGVAFHRRTRSAYRSFSRDVDAALAETGDDVNENRIVVMLRYRGFRELLMGHAGKASEARLLRCNAR